MDHFYGDDGAPLYLVEVGGEHLFTIPKLGYLLKAPQLIAHATRGWLNDASNVGSLAVGVVTFTPTATLEPTATKVPNTATPKPTATDIPDTETPEPTATSEPQDTAVPEQTATSESTSEIQETEAPTEEPQSTSTPEGIDPTPEGG